MSGELAGKIAVVTGSSRGIGRGTAIALAEKVPRCTSRVVVPELDH